MSQQKYEYFRDADDFSSVYRRRKGKMATYRQSRNGLKWYHVKAEKVPKKLRAYIHLLEEEDEVVTEEDEETTTEVEDNSDDGNAKNDDIVRIINGDEEDRREEMEKREKEGDRREMETEEDGHGHGHKHGEDDDDDDDDDILLIDLARRWRQNKHDQKDAANRLKETENSLHLQEQEVESQKQQLQELVELKTDVDTTEAKKVLPSKKNNKKKKISDLWTIVRDIVLTKVDEDIRKKKKKLQLLKKHVQHSKQERKESKQQLQNQEEEVKKTDREIYALFAACYKKKQEEIRNAGRLPESSTSSVHFFTKPDKRGMEDFVVPLRVFEKQTKKESILGVYGDAVLDPSISRLLPPNIVRNKPSKQSTAFSWVPEYAQQFTQKKVKVNKAGYYKYDDTVQNREALQWLFSCAQELNRQFRKVDVVEQVPYLSAPQTTGILQWDVPCHLPDWAQEALSLYRVGNFGSKVVTMETYGPKHRHWVPWDVRKNPRVEQNGLVLFNTCSVGSQTLTSALEHLFLSHKTKWSRLYTKQFSFRKLADKKKGWRWFLWGPEQNQTIVSDTLESKAVNPFAETLQLRRPNDDMKENQTEGIAVQVGWTGHARFMYVDHKVLKFFIYDPWMQSIDKGNQKGNKGFKELKRAIEAVGYKPVFVSRSPEQGREPTCQAVAMARLLQVALLGNAGATGPLDHVLVVLTARLLSMYAKKEKAPLV